MHHRNSAAWGRGAEGGREEKKTNNKEEQNKRKRKMKKKSMKERREEKKMRKERGYVGILDPLTTPHFWRCTPGTWCSRSLTKAGLVGGGWAGVLEEEEPRPPLARPGRVGTVQGLMSPRTAAGARESMTGGGKTGNQKINRRR